MPEAQMMKHQIKVRLSSSRTDLMFLLDVLARWLEHQSVRGARLLRPALPPPL